MTFPRLLSKRVKNLTALLGENMRIAEERTVGALSFSASVPHGASDSKMGTVMMTRIEMNNRVFAHASDIQLLDGPTVERIMDWEPDIVLAAGPPLYLERLSKAQCDCAWGNAVRLAQGIDIVILDHHLMRCTGGVVWLDELSAAVGGKVYCAADFMGRPKQLLEAERARLYQQMPVPNEWHDNYAKGLNDPREYLDAFNRRRNQT